MAVTFKSHMKAQIDAKLPPPKTVEDIEVRPAAVELLSGATFDAIEKKLGATKNEIIAYLRRVFPADDDQFAFLQDLAVANAALAGKQFTDKYSEMDASEAAKAFAIFSGKASEIKKIREADYKEPPVNVSTIIRLQQTLNKLTIIQPSV